MEIKLEEKNGIAILRIDGAIDINSSPDMKKFFDEGISKAKDKVVIDLKDVNYVDSSGLATLVEILKIMRARGGVLKLSGLLPKVKGLFEITKLDKLFDIRDVEEGAVGSF